MILGDISSQRLTLRRLPGSFAELTNKANQRQRGLNVKHRLMAMLFGNYSTSLQWDNSSTTKCAEVTCTSATEAMTWEFRCWYTDSPTLWDIQLIQPNYILALYLTGFSVLIWRRAETQLWHCTYFTPKDPLARPPYHTCIQSLKFFPCHSVSQFQILLGHLQSPGTVYLWLILGSLLPS